MFAWMSHLGEKGWCSGDSTLVHQCNKLDFYFFYNVINTSSGQIKTFQAISSTSFIS